MQKLIIVITGASAGMGKSHAFSLLKKGHVVYGLARRTDQMQDLVAAGGKAIAMDITDEAQITSAIEQIINEQGRIDVLINNAGYAVYGPVEEVPLDVARRQFEVNMFGLASITQKVLPHMRAQKQGRIINISSMGGKIYTPLGAWYHATKHALEGWSDCLRLEVADFGIDVVIIEPGGIETEFTQVYEQNLQGNKTDGPYSSLLQALEKMTAEMMKKNMLSKPDVITDLIDKAVHSKKPKIRYVAGAFAKPALFIRKYFGDRIYDKIAMAGIKK